jgi:hypothetical protein
MIDPKKASIQFEPDPEGLESSRREIAQSRRPQEDGGFEELAEIAERLFSVNLKRTEP